MYLGSQVTEETAQSEWNIEMMELIGTVLLYTSVICAGLLILFVLLWFVIDWLHFFWCNFRDWRAERRGG